MSFQGNPRKVKMGIIGSIVLPLLYIVPLVIMSKNPDYILFILGPLGFIVWIVQWISFLIGGWLLAIISTILLFALAGYLLGHLIGWFMDKITRILQGTPTIIKGSDRTTPQPVMSKSNNRGAKLIILVILITILFLCGGIVAVYKSRTIGNEVPDSTSPVSIQPTTKPALTVDIASLIGEWGVVSVEENGVKIVPRGNGATIELKNDGTYQASGGCNEMAFSTYEISPGSKLTFKTGGTKKKCEKNIVEFWDLNTVYAYEFENNFLLLHYE